MGRIARAIISVSDKRGVVDLARALKGYGVEILSTGGTAKALRDAGIAVKDVSEHTGFPEMMDGRVKTLHPKVHGGLLGRRDHPGDVEAMRMHGIEPIDMVVVNLYPFEQTVSKPGVTFDEAIENIDIGGPTMLRSSAKNFKDVTVVVDPDDYPKVLEEMVALKGEVGYQTRARLAKKVFEHTSRYDTLIADYLRQTVGEKDKFPAALTVSLRRGPELRYGENPHQRAAAYVERPGGGLNLFDAQVLQGKEMSFNNYLDAHKALMLVREFGAPACAIVKHKNPCGMAIGQGPSEALVKALRSDPVSAYGGVIGFNVTVDTETARELSGHYVEVVLAPGFSQNAIQEFARKPNVRLLQMPELTEQAAPLGGWDIKRVAGGLLLQEWDTKATDLRALRAVTRRHPTEKELAALEFAWRVVRHADSNAFVYAFEDRTVGIGIGQTSRFQAARAGAINALESLGGAVVASDGFIRFKDIVENIRRMGVTAIVQPGGSARDAEVIQAADEQGMAMLMTGVRHFSH